MAVSSLHRVFTFECRSDPDFASLPSTENLRSSRRHFPAAGLSAAFYGISSPILRFPPNFQRQLSTKARRNCSNIGVAQIVAASWSNEGIGHPAAGVPPVPAVASAVDAATAPLPLDLDADDENVVDAGVNGAVQTNSRSYSSFLKTDASKTIHAAERLGRAIVTDAITTPVVNTSAYFFKNTADLIDYKEKRLASYEYGRYGNPTSTVLEEKLSELEGAESTVLLASGMCASIVMLMALVPAGGHLVTTTDCYRKTRIFIETVLPKMGITASVIDPADVGALESALEQNKVSLFFTESPTNPFLRCVDIKLVSELCHKHGALLCIDGTFATPLNQKALALGADLVMHSCTKYIGGHHDVIGGCISGSAKLISEIRILHHILGGVLNPVSHFYKPDYLIDSFCTKYIFHGRILLLLIILTDSVRFCLQNAAYLFIRGMKTLHLRVQQQNSTGMGMAKFLEAHPKVKRVYYPGLPSHPEHELAMRQMTGFGGVVSFEIDGDLETTIKFIDSLKIPYIAPSFGGCESIVDQPAILSYWDLPASERAKWKIYDNLVRFSFGIEDFEDLKADIVQALEVI
ncbi:cystathionine gamma-synthase 1, chloroplastic isoform X1 [Lathyrus oleraceus]|uniref:cystathionine gamma-synthase 1, chloroplastic isoform X1 n=1 Tax=Pisum sativum TaxID=3888 RepID=UPI0021D2BFE2|nr:cystathionine gamma-synthase 1, chloroplastic-like isoform X1 [Pisum sativum]